MKRCVDLLDKTERLIRRLAVLDQRIDGLQSRIRSYRSRSIATEDAEHTLLTLLDTRIAYKERLGCLEVDGEAVKVTAETHPRRLR